MVLIRSMILVAGLVPLGPGLALAQAQGQAPAQSQARPQAQSQVQSQAPAGPVQFQSSAPGVPFLVLDQDRLFEQSAYGKRVTAELERRSAALVAENRSIESALTAEEQALTDQRGALPPDQFRQQADAFDQKVQRIRAEQDDKSRALTTFRDDERKRFLSGLGSVLSDLARSNGALAIMDRRALLVSADSIDITDQAVAAMDARFGDGTGGQPPQPPQAPAQP